jgi:hypothetical protein
LTAETAVERLRVTLRGHRRTQLLDSRAGPKLPELLAERIRNDVDRLDRAAAAVREWTNERHDAATRMWGHRLLARIALRLWDTYSLPPPREHTGTTSTTWRAFENSLSISSYLKRAEKHDFVSGQRALSMYSPEQLLRLAKDSYEAAYFLDTARAEVWVQVVALSWALGVQDSETADFERDVTATRHMAWLLSERVAKAVAATRDERSMAAAVGFESEVLAYLIFPVPSWKPIAGAIAGANMTTAEQEMDASFKEFIHASAPIAESYRAHCAWKQLRRYEVWAVARSKFAEVNIVRKYREQLEELGVRQYWGPRTRNDDQPKNS